MKTYRSLIPLALLSLLLFAIGCGSSDDSDGNGGSETDDNDRGTTSRDTGLGGQDDAATADTGSGGGACGAATPCSGNNDCAEDEYCNVGCCAERTGGGETDTGGGGSGVPCGELTYEGECEGTTVRWCQDGNAEEIDCATMYPAESATGSCEHISEEFGYWCAVQPGDTCVYSSNGELIIAFCTGTEPACILSGATQNCRENIGACTEADEGTCDDNGILIVGCAEGQPVGFDCVIDGGSCATDRCIDQGAGGICGTIGDVEFTCADGLTCGTESGTCEGGE